MSSHSGTSRESVIENTFHTVHRVFTLLSDALTLCPFASLAYICIAAWLHVMHLHLHAIGVGLHGIEAC